MLRNEFYLFLLYCRLHAFLLTSRTNLLNVIGATDVSNECRENKTHILSNILFFSVSLTIAQSVRRWAEGWPGFDSWKGHRNMEPTQSLIQCFPELQQQGREASYSRAAVAEVKNGGAILPLHHASLWRGAWLCRTTLPLCLPTNLGMSFQK
jgi:hypothetical protein